MSEVSTSIEFMIKTEQYTVVRGSRSSLWLINTIYKPGVAVLSTGRSGSQAEHTDEWMTELHYLPFESSARSWSYCNSQNRYMQASAEHAQMHTTGQFCLIVCWTANQRRALLVKVLRTLCKVFHHQGLLGHRNTRWPPSERFNVNHQSWLTGSSMIHPTSPSMWMCCLFAKMLHLRHFRSIWITLVWQWTTADVYAQLEDHAFPISISMDSHGCVHV